MELRTARLQVDALGADDSDALFACRADPAVARFQGWCPASVAEARAFIDAQAPATALATGWFQRAVRLREGDILIGDLGIRIRPDDDATVAFGISIAPAHRGHGYASETRRGLFGHAFDALDRHRVRASVDPRNLASMAMLQGLGMRQAAQSPRKPAAARRVGRRGDLRAAGQRVERGASRPLTP